MQASASTITNYHKSWGAKLCYRLSSPRTIQEILTTSDHCSILLLPSLGHTSPRNRRNLEGTCPRMPAEPPDTGSRPAASGGLPGRQRLAKNVKDMACQRGLHHVIIRYIYYIYIYTSSYQIWLVSSLCLPSSFDSCFVPAPTSHALKVCGSKSLRKADLFFEAFDDIHFPAPQGGFVSNAKHSEIPPRNETNKTTVIIQICGIMLLCNARVIGCFNICWPVCCGWEQALQQSPNTFQYG